MRAQPHLRILVALGCLLAAPAAPTRAADAQERGPRASASDGREATSGASASDAREPTSRVSALDTREPTSRASASDAREPTSPADAAPDAREPAAPADPRTRGGAEGAALAGSPPKTRARRSAAAAVATPEAEVAPAAEAERPSAPIRAAAGAAARPLIGSTARLRPDSGSAKGPHPPWGAAARRAGATADAVRRWSLRVAAGQEAFRRDLAAAWTRSVADPGTSGRELARLFRHPQLGALGPPSLGVLLCLLLGLRLARGRGDLIVSIEYPGDLRGTFSVRLSRRRRARRGPRTGSPAAAERARRRASASSPTERHLVSRETSFPRARSGRWYVTVDGFLQTQGDDAVVATHFEERQLRVHRGHSTRVDFDFHPRQCPVDVRISWARQPVSEARLAWRGEPQSLRYARNSAARLGAARGDQLLLVGSGDRVVEVPVGVHSFQPITVDVDLADRERVAFTACPPAVEPYLLGDLEAASRALAHEGQHEVAHVILARHHASRDETEAAARHLAEAGRTLEAAELHQRLSNFEESAALFESAGNPARAAEMYCNAGDLVRAGAAFERARELERAVACYREAGDTARWVEALEKSGRFFEAARISIENEAWSRAIRDLQLVPRSDDHYLEASQLLVEAYRREGHLDLATAKIHEVVRSHGVDHAPLDACDDIARSLEEGGEYESALELLELVRRRDAAWPGLATRIESLRKLRQAEGQRYPTAQPAPPSDAFGSEAFRYEILEEVGRGGMGIVFKARDRRLGRIVALKRLPDNLRNHPKAVELFLREARSAAVLNHPNIVTLFDAGQEGDTYYITMELLEGLPLQTVLERKGRLSPHDVVNLGIQIGRGLAYAHGAGIVHRDIKTGNFFVTRSRVVKIMDFGLARMLEEVRRSTTLIGGTPYYMAPEQGIGGAVDQRADLYALGVTFFELLTGTTPFRDGDVTYHHRHTPPPDPRERVAGLPDSLVELVLRMLAKQPDDRPQSAGEVASALQAILPETR